MAALYAELGCVVRHVEHVTDLRVTADMISSSLTPSRKGSPLCQSTPLNKSSLQSETLNF